MATAAPVRASRLLRLTSSGHGAVAWAERTLGVTSSGIVVFVLGVMGWIGARVLASRALFLLAYGVLIVLGVAFAIGRRRLAVEASRSDLPGRVREGHTVEVMLTLKARRRLTTILLEEDLHSHLGTPVRLPIPLLPGGEGVEHQYTFTPRLRGEYEVGPLVATWSDPFGLTRKRLVLAPAARIIVHPSTELVHDRVLSREWEDPPIRPPFSKPWPTGFEFYGMRDYVNGDDPRRIVWRATARTLDPVTGAGRYLVREAEQGITDRVTLILDTDARHHSPGDPSDTFELAVRAVASLGVRHLTDGFSVTVETNQGRLSESLRGARSRIPLLDALARVRRQRGTLEATLDRLLTDPRRNMHNVLVTPHVDAESARRLRLLLDRGLSILVVLVTWEETDAASLHRAGALGCNIIEADSGSPLEGAFRRVLGAGARR